MKEIRWDEVVVLGLCYVGGMGVGWVLGEGWRICVGVWGWLVDSMCGAGRYFGFGRERLGGDTEIGDAGGRETSEVVRKCNYLTVQAMFYSQRRSTDIYNRMHPKTPKLRNNLPDHLPIPP